MDELEQILIHIANKDSFLLSGGAGSGKTYLLVQVINQVIMLNPAEKVFCMTYTNTAVREIEERVNHKNLKVSTIHEFLWSNIKHFQKEIKKALIFLANDTDSKIKIDNGGANVPNNFFDNKEIEYKEFLKIRDGIISHDEIIILAEYMYRVYPRLSSILKDKYKYIFVDEYQDTHKEVIDILLIHLNQSTKSNVIGLFGDAMQSIYENGVDDISTYIRDGYLNQVFRNQNRRSPLSVINLANQLRDDGVNQTPSDDETAPNMISNVIKEGYIRFLYSSSSDLNEIREYLGWDFNNTELVKELNLTHNLISGKAGFQNLMAIYDKDYILDFRNRIKKYIKNEAVDVDFTGYTFGAVVDFLQSGKSNPELKKVSPTPSMQVFINEHANLFTYARNCNYDRFSKIYLDKEQLLDDKKQTKNEDTKKGSKRDYLIKHLYKIQNNISLYKDREFNEFIRATDYKITSIQDKRNLKESIDSLVNVGNKTIEEVILEADEKGICKKDDKLNTFCVENEYVFHRVKQLQFSEFQKLFEYLEGKTPFTTQHKTKGDEFDNVFVVLDNGSWSQYNFQYLMDESIFETLTPAKQTSYPKIRKRTNKIFYVCCTRAKEKLAVFYHNPSAGVISKAISWFGNENVINMDNL